MTPTHTYVVHARPDKAASIAAFARALALPDWFGGNLDALADALQDLADAASERDTTLEVVWDDVARLRAHDPDAADAIADVLAEVALDHPHVRVVTLPARLRQ